MGDGWLTCVGLLAPGASVEDLQKSVFLEKLIQKGYEVIFFTEPIDEYVMTHVTEYDDKKFQDASKDDVKLGKDDKKGLKKLKVHSPPLHHEGLLTAYSLVDLAFVL